MYPKLDFVALAELRYQIRVFLSFSERAARAQGVEPQQHQLLLAVKGLPKGSRPTLRVLAERLQLRHHSVVELADRLERRGLVQRCQSPFDRRETLLEVTADGEHVLHALSEAHQDELQTIGPQLAKALRAVTAKRAKRVSNKRK